MSLNRDSKAARRTMLSFMTFLFFASLSLAAYGKENKSNIEPKKEVISTERKGVIIYYDQSQSMPGYFKPKTASTTTLFEIFLQGYLLPTLSDNNIGPLSVAPFGSKVEELKEVNSPPDCWYDIYATGKKAKKKSKLNQCYPAENTRLDAVFSDKNLQDFGVALIISDGVQSIEKPKRGDKAIVNKESPLKCIEGSDIGCVKRAIKPLLGDGFGIWLIGIKTQFNGNVYPETPNLQGTKEKFPYKGLRPVYIFVLSKDVELGRQITIILSETLERIRSRFKTEGLKIESVELSPLFPMGFTPNLREELPGNTKSTILLDRPKVSEKRTFGQDGKCRGNKIVAYPLTISALPPPSTFIPQAVSWVPRLVMDEWQQGWINLSGGEWNPKKNLWEWSIQIDCGRMPSSIQDSKVYLTIYSEPSPITDVSSSKKWWYEWSTEDDSKDSKMVNASKTLNLSKLVSFIAAEATAKSKKDSTIIFQFFR